MVTMETQCLLLPEWLPHCVTLLTLVLLSSADGVSAPTTSTQVFYISVSVCCIVIFLVAIILAIMHLHSMKRVEMEDRLASSDAPHRLVLTSRLLLLNVLLNTECTWRGRTSDYYRWYGDGMLIIWLTCCLSYLWTDYRIYLTSLKLPYIAWILLSACLYTQRTES